MSSAPRSRLFGAVKSGPELEGMTPREIEWLIDGVLPHATIGMIYASDGTGKTWAAMSLALAVAAKGVWLREGLCASKERAVIYVDGEMKEEDLRERFLQLHGPGLPPNLHILSLASQTEPFDLSQEKDWLELVALVQDFNDRGVDVGLVVLDNWSALVFEKDENDNAEAKKIFRWPIKLRQAGVSTLWVHHAGVEGRQRGATARRGFLDYVVSLLRPEGHSPAQGARFVADFDKARRKPVAWAPLDVELRETKSGTLMWLWKAELSKGAAKIRDVIKGHEGEPVSEGRLRKESKMNGVSLQKALTELRAKMVVERTEKGWVLVSGQNGSEGE